MPHTTEQLASDINAIAAYLALDDFEGKAPGPEQLSGVDAIALLGNQVIATLTAAGALVKQAPAARLVVSGGIGHSTPLLFHNLRGSIYGGLAGQGLLLESMAEAEMYAAVAQAAFRIPAGRILLEDRSTNSAENARLSLELLKREGCPMDSVLIVQDPTMQRRSVVTWGVEARKAGVVSTVSSRAVFVPRVEPCADGSLRFVDGQTEGTWTMERFCGLILGEIKRLYDNQDGYGPNGKGFLPHVDVPEPVYASYLRARAELEGARAVR